jgi:hypothetical protein
MKIQLGKLREFIREAIRQTKNKKYYFGHAGSQPEESYSAELLDDPGYEKKSVYVPDDIKKKINAWAQDMGLSTRRQKELKHEK